MKKLIAGALIALALAACTRASSTAPPSPVYIPPTPSPAPVVKVDRAVLQRATERAGNDALKVYLTTPVGAKESAAITAIAKRFKHTTGGCLVGLPAFLSRTEALSYAYTEERMFQTRFHIRIFEGDVSNPSVLRSIEKLIESQYNVDATVHSAHIYVATLVGDCAVGKDGGRK